jgi:hypothetical protein
MTWTEPEIKELLAQVVSSNGEGTFGAVKHSKLVYRMLQQMLIRQTQDELYSQVTKHVNGVGFNGPDAGVLTSIGTKSKQYQNLTPKQTVLVAAKLKKYSKQLAVIAAAKLSQKVD